MLENHEYIFKNACGNFQYLDIFVYFDILIYFGLTITDTIIIFIDGTWIKEKKSLKDCTIIIMQKHIFRKTYTDIRFLYFQPYFEKFDYLDESFETLDSGGQKVSTDFQSETGNCTIYTYKCLCVSLFVCWIKLDKSFAHSSL